MKRQGLFALALTMTLILSACGTKQDTSQNNDSDRPAQSQNGQQEQETSPIAQEPAEEEHLELPRPLTIENTDEFIKIVQSEGEQHKVRVDSKELFAWSYYDGTLVVSCNGILEFSKTNNIYYIPWENMKDEITEVIITDGCTGFGDGSSNYGFIELANLVTVILPDGITNTPNFNECVSLEAITLPDTVSEIGSFYKCTALSKINIPPLVEIIRPSTFSLCSGMENIIIPEGVKEIDRGALAGCENLKYITIPSTVEHISESAFIDCNNLLEIINYSPNYVVDNGVLMDVISDELMEAYKDEIQNGNRSFTLNKAIIRAVSTLEGEYHVPFGYDLIANTAFKNCTGLTSIIFGEQRMKYIGREAFYGCTGLTYIDKLEGEVMGLAFAHCTSLKELTWQTRLSYYKGMHNQYDPWGPSDEKFTAIGDGGIFEGCTGIEQVAYPWNVWQGKIYGGGVPLQWAFKDTGANIYIEHSTRDMNSNREAINELIENMKKYYPDHLYTRDIETGEIKKVG